MYVVLPAGLAAGTAAGGAAGAGDGVGAGVACAGGALGAATGGATTGGATTGGATTGGVTDAVVGAFTTGGGAVSDVATGTDTGGIAAADVDTVELVAGEPATLTFDWGGAVASPAGAATVLGLLGADAAAGASATAPAGVADVVSPDSPAAARDALRGRRSALSAAMRSAAGFVFAKPAVYTISTAAEPRATRLLPRALDTRGGGARREARR